MKSKSTERRYKNMRNNKLNIAKEELVFPELTGTPAEIKFA